MEIIKVKGNTYVIDTGMSYLGFYKINQQDIIMIDSGWANELNGILEVLEQHQLNPVAIIGTHAHSDHVGNNAALKKQFACTIVMPEDEAHHCSSLMNLKLYYNTQTLPLSNIREHYGNMIFDSDILLSKNQRTLYLHGINFKLLPIPGHSMQLTGVITPDNVAYLGDALISEEVMQGYKLPFSFVLEEDLQSKETLRSLECSHYIVTHKKVYKDIDTLINQNIAFYKGKAENVYTLLDKPMSIEELLRAVVLANNIKISSVQKYQVVFRMFRCYVEYLHETGRIKQIIEDGFLKYTRC